MKRVTAILWRGLESWLQARSVLPAASEAPLPPDEQAIRPVWATGAPVFLHVGCGMSRKSSVSPGFQGDDWREIRLDIDPAVAPDVLSSMLDMRQVPASSMDGLYSSHNIEHLYPHEVPVALAEFYRVLKTGGVLVLTCPDLQSVCQLVAEDRLVEPAYISPAGPIAPLDILYGHRPSLADGNLFMAHRTGFTLRSLVEAVRSAGFLSVAGWRRASHLELWLVATKADLSEDEMSRLTRIHWPA